MRKGKKISLFFLFFFVFLLGANFVFGWEISYPELPGGGKLLPEEGLAGYINYFFNFALWVGGAIFFGVLIHAGVKYLTSVGDPSKTKDAKDQIFSALIGLAILVGAFFILNLLNPQLLVLRQRELITPPEIETPVIPWVPTYRIATCDEIPTYKEDILGTGDRQGVIPFEIAKINEAIALIEKANILPQKTAAAAGATHGCDCARGSQVSCCVCGGIVPVYCENQENICAGVRTAVENLRKEIEEGEEFVISFEKNTIEGEVELVEIAGEAKYIEHIAGLIRSLDIGALAETVGKIGNCYQDKDQYLYLGEQAEYLRFIDSFEELDFFCCY